MQQELVNFVGDLTIPFSLYIPISLKIKFQNLTNMFSFSTGIVSAGILVGVAVGEGLMVGAIDGASVGIFVGALGSDIDVPNGCEDALYEWAEDNEMDSLSQYYDCDEDYRYYGFTVSDVPVNEMDVGWVDDVKKKAAKFKELTGVDAQLIGSQYIT